mmetsp:Transcript_24206/g.69409  ORF Transcript_24206/g.69409 Transcript_24206/m.69409 type:complete len:210 (-) Transcript_24206:93-722(-)
MNLTLSVPISDRSRCPASKACFLPFSVRCNKWSGTLEVIVRSTLASDSPWRTKMRRMGRPISWLLQKVLVLRRVAVLTRSMGATSMYFPSSETRAQLAVELLMERLMEPCSSSSSSSSPSLSSSSSWIEAMDALFASFHGILSLGSFPWPSALMCWSFRICTRLNPASFRSASRRKVMSVRLCTPIARSLGRKSDRPSSSSFSVSASSI